MSNLDKQLIKASEWGDLTKVKQLIENGADQKILFEKWNQQQIAKVFLEIDDCIPESRHTNELCSESFELPKKDDWYVVWEDDSITIFENVHLASVEPELVKGVYVQKIEIYKQQFSVNSIL